MGTAYSQTLAATGDTPITWSIESGSLPAGLSLEASTGIISGIPTTVGTASFTVKATNASGSDTKALSIDIVSQPVAPAITTSSLPGGTVGTAYSQTLAATGDTPITWSIESGSLPEGLSLESETGVISGIPTTVGTASFTVKATNAAGSDTKALSIDIAAVGDNDVVPDINLRAAINEQLEVSNSDAPISKTQMESLQGDLSIVNKSVINLAGLQYAKNVTKLNLADNQISDLSPLSGLTNLEYLTLNNNQITNLSPMFGLTNLTLLSLTNNQISDLSSLQNDKNGIPRSWT